MIIIRKNVGKRLETMAEPETTPTIKWPYAGESPQPAGGLPETPAPEMPSLQTETVVMPEVGQEQGVQAEPANPFIPQGINPQEVVAAAPPPPKPGGLPKIILMIFVVLLLLGGLFLLGKFMLGFISSQKQVTINVWGLWENDSILQSVIADFEAKNPKIKISYAKQLPRQYRERLQAAIARGEGPDVFRFHNTWVSMLKNDLAIVPKTVMTPEQFSSTFYSVASSDLVGGGTAIFGIPMMIDGLGLYYNEDLFAAAGVSPPVTWEDVLAIVPKLTAKSPDNTITTSAIALGTTNNVENFSDIVATMMMQNGAKLSDPTGKEAEESLIFYRKFASPTDPVYTWNETLDNSIYAFATGKVAMILAPSWRAFDIAQINPALHFKITPIPQLAGNTVTWASYWVEGVSAKSKHSSEAWKFISYITGRDAVVKLYTEESKTRLFGEPYARVDLGSTIENDPYAGAYIKQAKTARSFPLASRTFDNGINDKLIKYLEDALNALSKSASPTDVLQTMAAGFRQVFTTYGLTSAAPRP